MKNIKSRVIALVVIVACISIAATTFNTPPGNQPGGFKNLKVLPKDISKDSLDHLMGEYRMALGVKCNFCHARSKDTSNHHLDFASDEKIEKEAARHMIKMTADINGNYFNWNKSTRPDTIRTVRCYTCHRGIAQPEWSNIMKQMQGPAAPAMVPAPPPPPAPHKD